MKQADLVEKTKINKKSLSSYISGKYTPKQNNIYLIAEALNVNEAWLMGYDVPMERTNNITNSNLNFTKESNAKQEIIARIWSIENLLTPNKIIDLLLSEVSNTYELSEELHITESLLKEALQYYKNKFGIYYVGENHLLVFEPLHLVEISY